MTTFRRVERQCAVCGTTATHDVLTSTMAWGAMDLDTRPPMLARLTLHLTIQCCPACGYCAEDVGEATETARAVVHQPEYQRQLRDSTFPYLANLYLCLSTIREQEGDCAAAGWAALRAAWACDDAGNAYADAAVYCRQRAITLFKKARSADQPFMQAAEEEDALMVDLLRRSGDFAGAKALIDARLAQGASEEIARILRLQQELCRRGDTHVHTVDEAHNG